MISPAGLEGVREDAPPEGGAAPWGLPIGREKLLDRWEGFWLVQVNCTAEALPCFGMRRLGIGGLGMGDRSDWKDVENLGDWFEAPFGGRGAGGAGDFGEIRRNS